MTVVTCLGMIWLAVTQLATKSGLVLYIMRLLIITVMRLTLTALRILSCRVIVIPAFILLADAVNSGCWQCVSVEVLNSLVKLLKLFMILGCAVCVMVLCTSVIVCLFVLMLIFVVVHERAMGVLAC